MLHAVSTSRPRSSFSIRSCVTRSASFFSSRSQWMSSSDRPRLERQAESEGERADLLALPRASLEFGRALKPAARPAQKPERLAGERRRVAAAGQRLDRDRDPLQGLVHSGQPPGSLGGREDEPVELDAERRRRRTGQDLVLGWRGGRLFALAAALDGDVAVSTPGGARPCADHDLVQQRLGALASHDSIRHRVGMPLVHVAGTPDSIGKLDSAALLDDVGSLVRRGVEIG